MPDATAPHRRSTSAAVTARPTPERPPLLLRRTPHLLRLFTCCFITSGLASALAVLIRSVAS